MEEPPKKFVVFRHPMRISWRKKEKHPPKKEIFHPSPQKSPFHYPFLNGYGRNSQPIEKLPKH